MSCLERGFKPSIWTRSWLNALETFGMVTEHDRQAFYGSEVERLEGEILLRGPAGAARATEQRFRRALEVARRQGPRSLELRAATSLARLWQAQGQREAARRLLAPAYGAFTEGFETGDLRAAEALLQELEHPLSASP